MKKRRAWRITISILLSILVAVFLRLPRTHLGKLLAKGATWGKLDFVTISSRTSRQRFKIEKEKYPDIVASLFRSVKWLPTRFELAIGDIRLARPDLLTFHLRNGKRASFSYYYFSKPYPWGEKGRDWDLNLATLKVIDKVVVEKIGLYAEAHLIPEPERMVVSFDGRPEEYELKEETPEWEEMVDFARMAMLMAYDFEQKPGLPTSWLRYQGNTDKDYLLIEFSGPVRLSTRPFIFKKYLGISIGTDIYEANIIETEKIIFSFYLREGANGKIFDAAFVDSREPDKWIFVADCYWGWGPDWQEDRERLSKTLKIIDRYKDKPVARIKSFG